MSSQKEAFWIALSGGIVISGVGIYMFFTNSYSDAFIGDRYGNLQHGHIDQYGALFLGILLLLLAGWILVTEKKNGKNKNRKRK